MLNITSRLTVCLKNLPEEPIDWGDTSPQRSRESLTISDFLPSERDAEELKSRAIRYMMRFFVTEFSSLVDLKQFVPPETTLHPTSPASVVPMRVLFKDEKYTAETIDILSQLMCDAQMKTNEPQVR